MSVSPQISTQSRSPRFTRNPEIPTAVEVSAQLSHSFQPGCDDGTCLLFTRTFHPAASEINQQFPGRALSSPLTRGHSGGGMGTN